MLSRQVGGFGRDTQGRRQYGGCRIEFRCYKNVIFSSSTCPNVIKIVYDVDIMYLPPVKVWLHWTQHRLVYIILVLLDKIVTAAAVVRFAIHLLREADGMKPTPRIVNGSGVVIISGRGGCKYRGGHDFLGSQIGGL
jgi:hypothetical protein